jgi:teichoic acid transport system permease protein
MTSITPVDNVPNNLFPLADSRSLRNYISELWERREFAFVVPIFDARIQNMDSVLGQIWHLLNPLLMVGIYYVIFGPLLDIQRGENYLGFLVVGVLLFQLTQRIVQEAALVVRRNEALIRSVQFPRGLLPISAVTGQTFAFLPAIAVLFSFMLITQEWPTAKWLLFPLVFIAQLLISGGLAFAVARIGFAFADLSQILPHAFRMLFYLSGILFSIDDFVHNPTVRSLFALNPLYDIITAARWTLMGTPLHSSVVAGLIAWAIVLPVVGLLFFRSGEARYGS